MLNKQAYRTDQEPIKLDKIDRKILYELDKNCRISNTKLGRIVGRSREAIAYRIEQLCKQGIIEAFIAFPNPSKFGNHMFKFYFQLNNYTDEREAFLKEIKALHNLWWVGIGDGVWDVHGTMFAKNVNEFYDIKNRLLSKYKKLVIKAEYGILVKAHAYPRRFLIEEDKEKNKERSYKNFAGEIVYNKLDEIDRKMINSMLRNARISLTELAKITKSTVDIVRSHLKRLEEKEIILNYKLAVNWPKLGYEYFKAFIYFKSYSEKEVKSFVEYASQNPNVVYVIFQLSSWDLEIEIAVRNYPEFNAVMNDFREKFPELIKSYESILMIEDCFHSGMLV